MSYGQVNADVIGTSVAGSNLGAGNASIMKNRIINGAMVIDQRNAGASSTPAATGGGTYTIDRFIFQASQASKFTVGQNLNSATPPVGFSKYLGFQVASSYSIGAGDYFRFGQAIEGFNIADLGWGTANAKTVTLSFQVYSSLTGTFGGGIQSNGAGYSYPFSFTVTSANTWTPVSITVAGPTTGTFPTDNTAGMTIWWSLGTGSTYTSSAGTWQSGNYFNATGATSVVGTASATFYITGVQLEVGSSATGFEYVNYQTSLANCQRYYQQIGSGMFIGSSSTTSVVGAIPFFTQMRATPTASLSGVMNVTDNSANYTQSSATINTNYMQSNGGALDLGGFSGITGFRPYWYASANSSNRFFNFSAEL